MPKIDFLCADCSYLCGQCEKQQAEAIEYVAELEAKAALADKLDATLKELLSETKPLSPGSYWCRVSLEARQRAQNAIRE